MKKSSKQKLYRVRATINKELYKKAKRFAKNNHMPLYYVVLLSLDYFFAGYVENYNESANKLVSEQKNT